MDVNLDPVIETAEVQRMINVHNLALSNGSPPQSGPLEIRKTVFFTGYLISQVDSKRLLTLLKLPSGLPESEIKSLANNILITPRQPSRSILDKIGGLGRKQTWQVTGTAVFESKIWAARVIPVPPDAPFHTDNPVPIVILALVKGARPHDASRIQNWQPVSSDKQLIFQSEVGEKAQLRVEQDMGFPRDTRKSFQNRSMKRMQDQGGNSNFERDNTRAAPGGPQRAGLSNDENRRPNGSNGTHRGGSQARGRGGSNANMGYQARHARGTRGFGNRGNNSRGRNGRGGYKSLDDVQNNSRYANHGSSYQPNYDDSVGEGPSGGTDTYTSSYPALGNGGTVHNNGPRANGDEGLPYGR